MSRIFKGTGSYNNLFVRGAFCFSQCSSAFARAFNNQTNQAHHGRCQVHTLWTIKEVTMAAQVGQILTNVL